MGAFVFLRVPTPGARVEASVDKPKQVDLGTLGTVGDRPQARVALLLARQAAIEAEAARLRLRREADYKRAELQRAHNERERRANTQAAGASGTRAADGRAS